MKVHQEEIYTLLSGDSTLRGLLNATTIDTHITSIKTAQLEVFPCITYAVSDGVFNTVPLHTQNIIIEFHIYAKESIAGSQDGKLIVENINNRLNTLMNYYQKANSDIFYIKQVLDMDMPENDRQLSGKTVRYKIWAMV